jgi:hypothetical protein
MKDFALLPTARRLRTGLVSSLGEAAKRSTALALAALMLPLGVGNLTAFGQEAPPPPPPDQAQPADQSAPPADQAPPPPDQAPPQQYNPLNADQLDQLVAPIALYPDSLVAQVLAAATYPNQVADADRFVQSNQGAAPDQLAQMANGQPWDPSVKALTAFPSVLSNLDKNLDWTTQLGNAYYNQPQDVMTAVQADRQQAYDSGKLRSTPQQVVTYAPGDVVIEPANPAVVYVPYYNPWVVWGWGRPWFAWYAPPPPPGFFMGVGVGFGFGFGIAVGMWGHWGWGWGHWGMGWGPHPFIAYNHFTYVSRSVTVVNHGFYGRFDPPAARSWNYQAAVASHNAWRAGYNAGARAGYNSGARAGYNSGARAGYNAGARAGYNSGARAGYNSGARAGYNSGARAGYSAGARAGYNLGENRGTTNSSSRPAQNYSRPAQSYNRPAQNYNRPAQTNNRPAQNTSHPASHPAPQSHPQGGGHPANHGGGNDHPHGR